ncbi:PH domain-containing protein [Aquipuribacter nitratireducens]|uniref:PH domain-containing protein n=1 Tax=Aquipuribacter nitratireducens TaxID=650104 RepID=A0ABW0GIH0_9MICO
MSGDGPEQQRQRVHRPLRPRWGRWVPYGVAVAWVVVFGALAAGYPPYPGIGVGDRVGFLTLAAAGAWLLHRFGGVAVLPDEAGVVVRNVLTTRRLEWAEVVGVRFGRDSTFARLDLSDGTTHTVLGIQSADGAHAGHAAVRLATLVELHGHEPRD